MSNKATNGLSLGAIALRAFAAGVPAADIEGAKALLNMPGVTLEQIEQSLMARAVTAKRKGPDKPTTLSVKSMDNGKKFLFQMAGNFFPFLAGRPKVTALLKQVETGHPEAATLLLGEGLKYSEFIRLAQAGEVASFLAANPQIK